ncbi:MAG: hypothetical protein M1816_000831 [Peltula sp. TS41687]|nr:MAG: hypothetical protein M1816_000831 [Peltula sp. TS41687]
MEISIPLTPPQATMSNVSPRTDITFSPVKDSIKRKSGYEVTATDMKKLRDDLSIAETDQTLTEMHLRHNALLRKERSHQRRIQAPIGFLNQMQSRYVKLRQEVKDHGSQIEDLQSQLE